MNLGYRFCQKPVVYICWIRLTIGGVGGNILDVGQVNTIVTIASSSQTSSTNGEEISVVSF